jgi:uncharacterized protein (DUF169 family)
MKDTQMFDNASASKRIKSAIQASRSPVAVLMLDEVPAHASRFKGAVAAGCVFWEKAGEKAIATTGLDHGQCAIGVYTHNLADPPANYQTELANVLAVLGDMQYARPDDVAQIPVMKERKKYVVYSPLEDCTTTPDVVLIFAQAGQGLIITEAIQQVDGGVPPALGRPACAVIPQVINSGRAALSLGCCGARAYLSILTDDVAMWALPGAKLQDYTERIAALSEANRILGKFHQLRMDDVAAGRMPSYQDSLARLQA